MFTKVSNSTRTSPRFSSSRTHQPFNSSFLHCTVCTTMMTVELLLNFFFSFSASLYSSFYNYSHSMSGLLTRIVLVSEYCMTNPFWEWFSFHFIYSFCQFNHASINYFSSSYLMSQIFAGIMSTGSECSDE